MATGPKESKDELFFSLPKEKLPFIGVIHSKLEVSNLKREFLSAYEPKELFISYNSDQINIRVQMSNRDVVQFYSQIYYNRAEFLVWLDAVKDCENINFGHLKRNDGKTEIILEPKTNQPFFFPVKKIFILDFKDKAAVRVIR